MRCLFLVAALLLCAQGAWAKCQKLSTFSTRAIDMFIGTILVPNDAVVGQKLREKDFRINTRGVRIPNSTCSGGVGSFRGVMRQGQDMNFPGLDNMYSTNVPGIGIRLLRTIDESEKTYYPHVLNITNAVDLGFLPAAAFRVEVYKTATVTGSGPLAEGIYTEYLDDDGVSILTTSLSVNAITVITPSCSVDLGSRNIPVNFGKVTQSNFKGKGSTTGDRKFNIRLNCKAGVGEQNTIYLRMDATPDPSNEQGVLKITQAGSTTATGVGIQVVSDKSGPVKFGEEALVGPSIDGSYVLPYTARYFQTGDKVTPGRADGVATFTIEYQ